MKTIYITNTKLNMRNNRVLHKARKGKNDEFYTMYEDIEKELKHYDGHFNGKVVYCNCDNPEKSNFTKYFMDNFERLGLKRLISSCYIKDGKGRYAIYDGGTEQLQINEFEGNGDFRSEESIELLKQADIVVSNPAFSLFREYIAQLVKYDKKFLVIGNMNAITYKEIFPLIKDNKLWFGYGFNITMIFRTPYENTVESNAKSIISKGYDPKHYIMLHSICWFTNLENDKENKYLLLNRTYNEKDYPKFENYNAINVDKVKDIPYDYDGVMGVPITFLGKYNPKHFEIVDARTVALNDKQKNKNTYLIKDADSVINGKPTYARICVKRI